MRAVQRSIPLRASSLLVLALAWPAVVPLPAHAQPAAVASPVVDAVEVNADAGLNPGSTLDFSVRGTPRAQARVQLVGSGIARPLHESAPGLYTGRYTLGRADRIDVSQPIQATLRANGRMLIATFDFPRSFPALRRESTPVAQRIPARTDSSATDPLASVQPTATLGAAPSTVAPVVVTPVAVEPLSLQVLSPAAGTTVESSSVLVRGRTTPFATVHAQAHAIAPTPVGRAAVALPVMQQSVQADANGNFSFGLGAQAVPPGSRLDVQLEASEGARSTPVQRLELYQRQG